MPDFEEDRKALLDLLVSQLSEFVIVLANKEGHFTSWHPGVEQQFGYRSDEFLGEHAELLFPLADRLKGIPQQELDEAAQTGRSSDTKWLVKKTGKQILVDGVTLGLRDHDGRFVGFGKVLQDVTDRKNVEDDLSAITRALEQSTVFITDWDGVIGHWTAGCERLYGWTAKEAIGKQTHDLLETSFPVSLVSIQEQLLKSGTWQGELGQTTRDGRQVLVSAHWVSFSDGVDDPRAIIATHTDITGRSVIQAELEAANTQLTTMAVELERSNKDLEEFARIASHDLSAPIVSTRWLVDLLSLKHGSRLDSDGQKLIKQITQGLDRMSDLIQGVLAHAMAGRKQAGDSAYADMELVLAATLQNLTRDIETSGARITHDPLPEIKMEPQALNQLLQNILSNALKYRRDGVAPRIHVQATDQGAMWLISIRDNGIGIEPEWHERIFLPMQRRHGLEVSGSGIGLATCKKIVSYAGGKIWVESQLGSGSTFFFTVPKVEGS